MKVALSDRVDIVGGTWTITTTPGNGTTVTGTVPADADLSSNAGVA